MYIGSFIMGLISGTLPDPLNWMLIVPTIVVFVSAETDMFMKQIYSFPCIVGLVVGLGFIALFHFNLVSYLIHMIFCIVILLLLRMIKAINIGDVELILSLTPYLYLVSYEFKRPTFIESFLFYMVGSCIFTVAIYFKKYRKEKIKTFPFALPACLFYCSYFGVLSIASFMN